MARGMDEVQPVDRAGASEQAAGRGRHIAAELRAGNAGQAAAEAGHVMLGEGVVPGQDLRGLKGNRVGRVALDEQHAEAGLGNALSSDNAGSAADDNNT